MTSLSPKDRVDKLLRFCHNEELRKHIGGTYTDEMEKYTTVEDAYVDKDNFYVVVFKIKTQPWMRNGHNIVHGGAVATIVDFTTSFSEGALPALWPGDNADIEDLVSAVQRLGVSRRISVQYVQATPIGEDIFVKCKVLSSTKRNSYITCEFFNSKGRLLVAATHDKVKLYAKL